MKTKNNTLLTLAMSLMCILLCGCTQNNGHIGKLFGSWGLTSMMIDAEPYAPGGETTLSFQSNVAVFIRNTGDHTYANRVCTWSRNDGQITFDFEHHDDKTDPGADVYAPPGWLLLDDLKITMTITRLDNGHLDMVYVKDGKAYIYKFERTW